MPNLHSVDKKSCLLVSRVYKCMSVTPELRASARATYRLLFRTAANTFRGDERVLNGFREKVRNEYRQGRSVTDVSAYSARIQFGREVADVLRKNIVQGVKVKQGQVSGSVPSASTQDVAGDVWRVRLAKDTELGSNETVKVKSGSQSAQALEGRQSCCQSSASASASADSLPSSESCPKEINDKTEHEIEEMNIESHPGASESLDVPTGEQLGVKKKFNYSTLKRLSQTRLKPVLNEDDLEETFVRGSGPGGQSINKTSNNVQLLHKPTGIRVTCQETRSLQSNRLIARKNLIEKLDQIANPGLSKENLKRAKQVERERRRRKKAKKKARAKDVEGDSD